MKTEQRQWTKAKGWSPQLPAAPATAQLVLVFGDYALMRNATLLAEVRAAYPEAQLMGCTTAGEICGVAVSDESLVITAITFEHSQVRGVRGEVSIRQSSFECGQALARAIPKTVPSRSSDGGDALAHVFVLSDGLKVNGSELVAGLMSELPATVGVTGGLAGDNAQFQDTLTVWGDAINSSGVVLLGLYGARLKIGFSSLGGWDAFGPERLVTRSHGNVLFELDGRSALELYKKYLGEHARGLPATALLFPLSLRTKKDMPALVRTILNVDDAEQSMTFAGDIPEGSYVRLMKSNFDHLIDGAAGAAQASMANGAGASPALAILISCVGRKLVLRQRTEEEIEAVRDTFGPNTMLAGFYSYGELAPLQPGTPCELHNQSMTITTISES